LRVRIITALLILTSVTGCSSLPMSPSTEGERYSSYTYVPLDPLPIRRLPGDSCPDASPVSARVDTLSESELLKTLTDQTVRMAVAQISSSGEVTFTSAKIGAKNESYQVVLDYMNTDTAPLHFAARRKVQRIVPYQVGLSTYRRTDYKVGEYISIRDVVPPNIKTSYEIRPMKQMDEIPLDQNFEAVSLPIYVGLGLRLTASFTVNEGKVELTGLPSIAANAAAGKVSGSLVVQTLGVTGRAIATSLPLPSELNQTTLQNSLLAIGSIKALIHDSETTKTPRVIGFQNAVGGGQEFVSAIISALSLNRLAWYQACR
jgi:hypothetical protein